jgi:hypothetical protein
MVSQTRFSLRRTAAFPRTSIVCSVALSESRARYHHSSTRVGVAGQMVIYGPTMRGATRHPILNVQRDRFICLASVSLYFPRGDIHHAFGPLVEIARAFGELVQLIFCQVAMSFTTNLSPSVLASRFVAKLNTDESRSRSVSNTSHR